MATETKKIAAWDCSVTYPIVRGPYTPEEGPVVVDAFWLTVDDADAAPSILGGYCRQFPIAGPGEVPLARWSHAPRPAADAAIAAAVAWLAGLGCRESEARDLVERCFAMGPAADRAAVVHAAAVAAGCRESEARDLAAAEFARSAGRPATVQEVLDHVG